MTEQVKDQRALKMRDDNRVGNKLPDFELPDHHGEPQKLSN